MQVGLPHLQDLSDIRKYLLIIETLELERLNNTLVVPTPLREQAQVREDLLSMKGYHKELTDFLIHKQNEFRKDQFAEAFVREMQEYLQFWANIMATFKEVSRAEIEAAIDKNEVLKEEFNELMEKHLGFRPPPQSAFLNLQVIRKLVARLRLNDPIQFVNFDFYKKMNIKLNEDWVRDRRLIIIKKMDILEKRLAELLRVLQQRLVLELQKLHVKRLRQFDQLMTKYTKIKNHISELNSKERFELKKTQQFYNNRVAVTTYFHKNDLFLKGMNGTTSDLQGTFLNELSRYSVQPESTAKGVLSVRSQTPNLSKKDRASRMDTSITRTGNTQRKSAAVVEFGPKNNFFGHEKFLGEIDVAKAVKDKKRKTVRIEGI
jgi:hypothetical protein